MADHVKGPPTGHRRSAGTIYGLKPFCCAVGRVRRRSANTSAVTYRWARPLFSTWPPRELVLGLVGAGFGITIVSEAATGAAYPGIVFRHIDEPDAVAAITAAWLQSANNPARKKFLASLRDYAKRDGADKSPVR